MSQLSSSKENNPKIPSSLNDSQIQKRSYLPNPNHQAFP